MADNVNITVGDGGKIVASDDIQVDAAHAQGQVQFVKLVDGALDGTGSIRVNQAAKANALTVAPASDISDPTYIGDIKFGEALIAGTNLIGKVGIDQTTPGTTNRVDIGALIPGVGATNLGKTEDAGHTTGDVGVMMLGVRNDSDTELAGTDLDYCPVSVDLHGHIIVIGSQDGQTAVDYTHGLQGIGGIILDALPATDVIAGAGEWGVFQMTQYGEMRVKDESANTLLGTIDTDIGNMLTALQLIDNAVDGNYLNVNLNINGTDCDGGSGGQDAQTLRVILATDDPAVALLGTIDTDTGIIAGDTTSIDGKITACDTGAVVISSGTVTTVSTVTSLSQLGGQAINLGEGIIATGTQRITLATDDDAVASLGVIDDWDATHDSAVSADGPQMMAAYDSTKPTAVDSDADAVRILADAYGRLLPGLEPEWFNAVYDSSDARAEGKVVKAGTGGKKIYVLSCILSSDVEGWMKLQDEDGNPLTGKMWFRAGGGTMATWPPQAPLVLDIANKDLEIICEAAGDISVTITGYLAP